jgi:RES domain-containing protein
MTVYRITNSLYKEDLSGNGAKENGGRWNYPGFAALYTSEHISLCVLEMLVNISLPESQLKYHLLTIEIPDLPVKEISLKKLKLNWQEDEDYTRFIGTEFLKNKESLFLKLPSAVINNENNFFINPLYSDFSKVKLLNSNPFIFDKRLFIY